MSLPTFQLGDFVKVTTVDGAEFFGDLMEWTADYMVVGGRGFPHDGVKELDHAA
jgi:hypothetical protein